MSDLEDIIPERKRNPLVPIGALITAGVLCGGLYAFKQGNSRMSQYMMRARVIAQGATVAIMVGSVGWGGLHAAKDKAA